MAEWQELEDPELQNLFKKHLIRGAIFLAVLVAIIFIVALIFEQEINEFAQWLTVHFGVYGLMITVFIADLFVSPIPPDAALFFIGRGPMHDHWLILVPILGAISSLAGVFGWLIGHRLKKTSGLSQNGGTFRTRTQRCGKKIWLLVGDHRCSDTSTFFTHLLASWYL